eukprot:SAG11_NODE_159_length_14027_cov_6.893667_1_plen_95_part_00
MLVPTYNNMTVISILYPILWVYPILRVFLLNTKYCPRTKYDCIVSAESFRSFTGHDFIHLYIQIRWGTLELVEEEAMCTEYLCVPNLRPTENHR